MARCSLIAALLGITALTGPRLFAAEPRVKEVVRRIGAYVQSYGEKTSIVVAIERYTQEVTAPNIEPAPPKEYRVLVADFAIVKAAGFGGWVGYRDVVEVNGKRLSDRQDRLVQMLTSDAGLMDEAQGLSHESARYNIGPIQRNFNVPTSALFFFIPDNLDRFKFTRKGIGRDGVWEIGFRETVRPTIVRTPMGVSVPAEGSVWVDVATGTVVRTRVRFAQFGPPSGGQPRGTGSAEIDVTYRRVPALEMWLPDRMAETYDGMFRLTTCEAKYTDYRQFQTSVRIK